MATDQIIDLIDLIEEDPAWLSEFYSAVANSEMVIPMILCPGHPEPVPVWTQRHSGDTIVFNPEINDYVPIRTSIIDPNWYFLVYSNQDVFKSVKPVLESKYHRAGRLVDPVAQNGRQIINNLYKRKRCAIINLFAPGSTHYVLSPEQMEIIRQKPVTAKPEKAGTEKETALVVPNGDALAKLNYYREKIEKLERGNLQLQKHLLEAMKENAELESRLTGCERRIAGQEASLAAFQDAGVPATVWEAVEYTARRFASRLVVHPRVRDIAEAWTYKKKCRCVAHTVKMLVAVARTLYEMKFESPDGYIDPLEFQAITGYELAMTEGRLTKRNQYLDGLRYCKYEDRTVPIYAHLKKRIGDIRMRIYIGFLEEERRILIGQVGAHMPNSQTAGL